MKNRINNFCNIHQKKICILLSIFLSIISYFTFIIAYSGKVHDEYKFVNTSNTDICITKIYIDNNNYHLADSNLYNSKKDCILLNNNIDKNVFKISISNVSTIYAEFDNKKNIEVYKNNSLIKNGKIKSYYNDNRMMNVFKTHFTKLDNLKNIVFLLIIPFILIFLVNYLCVYLIKKLLINIKSQQLKIIHIITGFLALSILYLFNYYMLLQIFGLYIIIPLMALLILIIYTYKDVFKKKIEYAFVIVSLFVGITMLFTLPPFHVPDESSHFIKSYQNSDILVDSKLETDEVNHVFIYLPQSVKSFYDKYSHDTLEYNIKYSARGYISEYFVPLLPKNITKNKTFYAVARASTFAYIPSIIVLSILKLFNISPIILFIYGRFINLLIWSILSYLAIKIAPKYKNLFFIIMLFPISIHQAIGYNQDWLNNCLFFLVAALIFKEIFSENKIEKKNIILIIILSVMLSLCKTIYSLIALLMLLIPNHKVEDKNKKIIVKYCCPLIVFMFTFIIYKLSHLTAGSPPSSSLYTLSMAIKDPIRAINMILSTIKSRITLDLYRGQFDGFGWSTIWLPDTYRDIISIIYFPLIVYTTKKEDVTLKEYIIYLVIFLVLFAMIYYAMMFSWTKDYMTYIDGLQPRYFIPGSLFLYIILSSFFTKTKDEKVLAKRNIVMYSSVILIYFLCFITIIGSFY